MSDSRTYEIARLVARLAAVKPVLMPNIIVEK
jgi:hypothetical protein